MRETLSRLLTTRYQPDAGNRAFAERAQTQRDERCAVTVAVLDAKESQHVFGVHMAKQGIQPVFVRVENRSPASVRLQPVSIDPNYYTPLEAAALCHFSIAKRLSAFGLLGWLFVPMLLLLPLKLITAYLANRRMDELFRTQAFHLRPIAPGAASEGFVFTSYDAGTKVVHVRVLSIGDSLERLVRNLQSADAPPRADESAREPTVESSEFTFTIAVPGIAADYLRRDFDALVPASSLVACDVPTLVSRIGAMPAATTNARDARPGDPVNLVMLGDFDELIAAFAARWDECETITWSTCWKTARAFLLGSDYRYSPVSPLHLFGRSQDIALQRTRRSINERLHLRLWITPLRYESKPVWVGQVSRDIGVRFTTRAWNLTTHRIDPDVDEARDYVLEDLLHARRVVAAGYVEGVGPCDRHAPRRNLTGDPYFTDGKRAVVVLSDAQTTPRFVGWA